MGDRQLRRKLYMGKLKSFFDNPEEIYIGACLQFPLYFIVKWWVLPIMLVCGLLWRYGGWVYGNKLARRLGVPLTVCISAYFTTKNMYLFLATPFMVRLAPSYGKDSWLYKLIKDDFLTHLICFAWYWAAFAGAYLV